MISTGLSDKKVNIFSAVFKNTFKRNLPGYIILNIVSAMYAFVASLTVMDFNFRGTKFDHEYFYEMTYEYTVFLTLGISLITAVAGFVIAIKQFHEIFKRQSSDFYFSLPVNRGTYVNSSMLYGAICIFSAFFTAVVFSIVFTKTPLVFAIEYFGMNLPFLLQTSVNAFCSVMVCYALFMLCVAASGSIWQVFLFSAAAIISSFAGSVGIAAYLDKIYGLSVNSVYISSVTPVGNIIASAASEGALKYVFILISAAEFAIVFTLCHKVFRCRGAETAENIPGGKFVPVLMIVFWQIAAFSLGTAFDLNIVLCVLIGIVCAFAATLVYTALIYKRALNKQMAISFIGVSAAGAVFAAAVAFIPQSVGYTEYIPEPNEIEYVCTYGFDDYRYDDYNSRIEDYINNFTALMDSLINEDYENQNTLYRLESEESVSKLISLHQRMFDDDVINPVEEDEDEEYYGNYVVINIEYHLKNGKKVNRKYLAGSKATGKNIAELLQTEEALEYQKPFNTDRSKIMFIGVSNWNTDTAYYENEDFTVPSYYSGFYAAPESYDELFDAIKKDKMAEPAEVFLYNSELSGYYGYENPMENAFDLTFYSVNEYATDEDIAFFESHSPQEILAYGYSVVERESRGFPYDEIIVSFDTAYDKNTVEYLKSIGVDF